MHERLPSALEYTIYSTRRQAVQDLRKLKTAFTSSQLTHDVSQVTTGTETGVGSWRSTLSLHLIVRRVDDGKRRKAGCGVAMCRVSCAFIFLV